MDDRVSKRITIDLVNIPINSFEILRNALLDWNEQRYDRQLNDARTRMLIQNLDELQEAEDGDKD